MAGGFRAAQFLGVCCVLGHLGFNLAELFFGIHRASLSQLLGLCEEEQGKQALPVGSAASRDPHELRPHKGLGVVQRLRGSDLAHQR